MRLLPAQLRASRRVRTPRTQLTYTPALDGVRGVAVLAVVLYHAGLPWAGGGFLGVELFFVLSGFLITSLLLAEWRQTGGIGLRGFWGRRARRLLPALFALLAVVGAYYALAGPAAAVPGLRGDGIATLRYYANWHQIAAGSSYFAATGPVSPLTHTWSLAIEEQFYAVWPLVVLAALAPLAARRRAPRGPTPGGRAPGARARGGRAPGARARGGRAPGGRAPGARARGRAAGGLPARGRAAGGLPAGGLPARGRAAGPCGACCSSASPARRLRRSTWPWPMTAAAASTASTTGRTRAPSGS
jgi:hypothetical protein